MEPQDMIALDEFCASHQVQISFIQTLEEHGLIQTIIVNQTRCVHTDELSRLEKILRLNQELNINPEGIDAIIHLLQRIDSMQNEVTALKNRLNFYEEHE
jgi:chaperone modulatory protein CbpM